MNANRENRFQKFEIAETIKKTECTAVYVARHIDLDRKVLLKTLCTTNKETIARFKREARLLAKLDHPNIIRVFDFGVQNNELYISFEYVEGSTLRSFLGSLSDQPFKESATKQLWKGLSTAHAQGIVHRDLKPENILVSQNTIKIADFGLAFQENDIRVTGGNGIIGTPGYMSPEQIQGGKISAKSDLFSLGIVLYELWTGKHPFLGKDIPGTLNRILSEQDIPDFSNIPEPWCSMIRGLLQKQQQERSEPRLPEKERPHQSNAAAPVLTRKIGLSGALSVLVIIIGAVAFFSAKNEQKVPLDSTEQNRSDIAKMMDQHPVESDSISLKTQSSEKDLSVGQKNTLPGSTPGFLSVECYPWAEVMIDGKHVDTTPLQNDIRLFPGQYTVELAHPDFPSVTKKIRIQPNEQVTFHVRLDTVFGYFNSLVHPWANIYIDESLVGQTPLQKAIPLLPGKHSVKLEHPNYQTIIDTIDINKNDTLVYRFNYNRLLSDRPGLP